MRRTAKPLQQLEEENRQEEEEKRNQATGRTDVWENNNRRIGCLILFSAW